MIRFLEAHKALRRITCILLLCNLIAPLLAETATGHTFKFDASGVTPQPKSVAVAGSFNGWSKDAHPMKSDGKGLWQAELPLPDGTHYYKFVIDGDKWMNDPNSDKELEVDDTFGGHNSAVLVGPDARKLPPPQKEAINSQGILFDLQSASDVNVAAKNLVRFHLRTQKDDAESVFVNLKDDGLARSVQLYRVSSAMGYDSFATATTVQGPRVKFSFTIFDGHARTVVTPDGAKALSRNDDDPFLKNHPQFDVSTTPKFETPDWAKTAVWYQIFPERFRNGDPSNDPGDKWYEKLIGWKHDWWKSAPNEAPGEENFYKGAGNVWSRRYGGDIQGVMQSLPYLRSLGINAIYFNPVFEAESMHKYDTADYRHIDDNFGVKNDNEVAILPRPVPEEQRKKMDPQTVAKYEKPTATSFQLFELDGTPAPQGHKETDDPATWKWSKSDLLFLQFMEEAHRQGFKVVIDGVFNHVGRAHPFFQDVLANGKNSKYADWFEITDWGDPKNWRKMSDPYSVHGKPGGILWKAWDSENGHLPAFKKDKALGLAKGPRDHIFAITKRWLAPGGDPKKGIDGWRLDVPGDIPHPFWIEWRRVVKGANPDAYISGEIWGWAQPWLNDGDQFDAVMNYRFATAAQDFFVNQKSAITPTQLASRLNEMIYNYPFQVALVQMNLFDSHDTDRFASMFVNPDLAYDAANRIQDNGPGYSPDKPDDIARAKQKLAVTLQHTFVGAPMTYYGNETGMFSPDDPSNRQPMWWRDLMPYEDPEIQFDEDLFTHYQRVIALRRQFPALSLGFFHPLKVEDSQGVLAFAREYQGQVIYVVLNRSGSEQTLALPVEGEKFVNLADETMTVLKPDISASNDARPVVSIVPGAAPLQATNNTLTVTLKPYGSAILTSVK